MAARGRAYLDHNATAPVRPEVIAAVAAAMAEPGNPSSLHEHGQAARRKLAAARARVASWVGARAPEEVIFTSGGTEANDLSLASTPRILASAVEHVSVLAHIPGERILPVDDDGVIDLDALRRRLLGEEVDVVAVMLANNETGVIQPVAEVAALVHAAGAMLHVDATQAVGRIPVDAASLGADRLAFGVHKAGGPLGTGALVATAATVPPPRLRGGAQEGRRRAGTENLPAISGMAVLADVTSEDEMLRLAALRDRLEAELRAAVTELRVVGAGAPRLPNTSCLLLPGVTAEAQLMALDLDGIAVGAGAACSSGRIEPSHVLRAMGLASADAACAIRVSLGWSTTEEDVGRVIQAYSRIAKRALARRAAA